MGNQVQGGGRMKVGLTFLAVYPASMPLADEAKRTCSCFTILNKY